MRKRFVMLGILLMLVTVLTSCTANGGWIMLSSSSTDNGWTLTAKSADTGESHFADLDDAALAAFQVKSTSSTGKSFLTITQGDTEISIDISGEFDENIDMSGFEPGQIKFHLNFEKANDVDVAISW